MSPAEHIAALPNVEDGHYLVCTEWGELNHLLRSGALWREGVMVCGRRTKLVVPPQLGVKTCAKCERLKDGPNVP